MINGKCRSLIVVLIRHFLGGTVENYEKYNSAKKGVSTVVRPPEYVSRDSFAQLCSV
jgi:hypothetical protein